MVGNESDYPFMWTRPHHMVKETTVRPAIIMSLITYRYLKFFIILNIKPQAKKEHNKQIRTARDG